MSTSRWSGRLGARAFEGRPPKGINLSTNHHPGSEAPARLSAGAEEARRLHSCALIPENPVHVLMICTTVGSEGPQRSAEVPDLAQGQECRRHCMRGPSAVSMPRSRLPHSGEPPRIALLASSLCAPQHSEASAVVPSARLSVERDGPMLVQANANDAFGPALLRPLNALAKAWQRLMSDWSDSYQPEKHYMRGPGPKWCEKRARQKYTMATRS